MPMKMSAINMSHNDGTIYEDMPGEQEYMQNEFTTLRLPNFTEALRAYQENEWVDKIRELPPAQTDAAMRASARLHAQMNEERDACIDVLRHENIAGMDDAAWDRFMRSRELAGARLRMDPEMGRDVNLRRMRSEVLYFQNKQRLTSRTAATAPEGRESAQAAYDEIKAGVKDELLNTLNYVNDLELTEADMIARADELLRTSMSILHLSDIGKIINPSTGQSLKLELFGPEYSAIFSVIVQVLSALDNLIQSSALALGDEELNADIEAFDTRGPESRGRVSTREFLRSKRKTGLNLLRENKEGIADIVQKVKTGTLPPLPDGVPAPLYRAPVGSP
jgi:hypothetical protein